MTDIRRVFERLYRLHRSLIAGNRRGVTEALAEFDHMVEGFHSVRDLNRKARRAAHEAKLTQPPSMKEGRFFPAGRKNYCYYIRVVSTDVHPVFMGKILSARAESRPGYTLLKTTVKRCEKCIILCRIYKKSDENNEGTLRGRTQNIVPFRRSERVHEGPT